MNKQMMSALILSVSLVSGMAFAQSPQVESSPAKDSSAKEEVHAAREKLAQDKKENAPASQVKADAKALKKAKANRKKEKKAAQKGQEKQQEVQEPAK